MNALFSCLHAAFCEILHKSRNLFAGSVLKPGNNIDAAAGQCAFIVRYVLTVVGPLLKLRLLIDFSIYDYGLAAELFFL